MAHIRDDLVGVVTVRTGLATTVTLRAGDEVPDGVKIGEHLLEEAATSPDAAPATTRPAPTATKAEWVAYAEHLDLDVDATWPKAEIVAAVTAAEAD